MKNVCLFTIPHPPQANRRPRAARTKTGRPFLYDDPRNVKYKRVVAACAKQAWQAAPTSRRVWVWCYFFMPRPRSHYGTGKNAGTVKASAPRYHIKKPDIDNLIKVLMDALTGIVWQDDTQVIHLSASKAYQDDPGSKERTDAKTVVAIEVEAEEGPPAASDLS